MPQGPAISTISSMADVWDAYRDEIDGVEQQVRKNLDSSVTLVNTVAAHILSSGGKRVRPLLLLLSARACGYIGREHHQLGSLVEFIHTATLLHDDVVDDADIRRGRQTARKVWGNQISILVGDYLYSKAMAQVVEFRSQGINEVLAEACTKMAEGEVLQLYHNGNPSMPESDYIKIVEHKTAGLMAAACRMGAILAEASEDKQTALFRFGQYIGIAFQVADDTLDYNADGERLGKTLGQDLRQGKATLPLLHLLAHCSEQDRTMIKDRMETRTLTEGDLARILALMHDHGSLTYAMERARTYIAAAKHELEAFEDSTARRALAVAADYMITRDR
ncbi:MAG: polyprenyl synthetase family protein [Nitrospira sp.]|jgi:octaprenyl-diphosphate synthase|nr:polyprenyl synthetase family protein [Nitrospira sp.]